MMPESGHKTGFLVTGILVAAVLWFYMFSPWTSQISNFWLNMTASAVILSAISICGLRRGGSSGSSDGEPLRILGITLRWKWLDSIIGGDGARQENETGRLSSDNSRQNDGVVPVRQGFWKKAVTQVIIGVAVAFALWGVFWIGDKVSQLIFDFARGQVDNVYGMKSGVSPALITVLLLFLIGPAEEFFWRGFVQRMMSERIGATAAMFVTVVVYALVHIWSFNFMLVMAALVAGAVWGFIYRLKPSLLPALIISHALWDALVFVLLPI